MAAVLILFVFSRGFYSGVGVTTAEFASIEACEAAGRAVEKKFPKNPFSDNPNPSATWISWSCSPKTLTEVKPSESP